jgi:hypothetical protein
MAGRRVMTTLLPLMLLATLAAATDKLDNRQRQFTAYDCSSPVDKVAFEAGGVRECCAYIVPLTAKLAHPQQLFRTHPKWQP